MKTKNITHWVTISSRIMEYKIIAKEEGLKEAKRAIKIDYGSAAQMVYNGLRIIIDEGIDAYYGPLGARV